MCTCLRGKLGLSLEARDSPFLVAGTERGGWATGQPRGWVGQCSCPPTSSPNLLMEPGSGGPECHPGASQATPVMAPCPSLAAHPNLPQLPMSHVPAWLFRSSRAKLPVPRVYGEYPLLKSPANSVTSFNNNKLSGEMGGCSAFIFI